MKSLEKPGQYNKQESSKRINEGIDEYYDIKREEAEEVWAWDKEEERRYQLQLRGRIIDGIKNGDDISDLVRHLDNKKWIKSEEAQLPLYEILTSKIKNCHNVNDDTFDRLLKYANQQTKEQIQPLLRERAIKEIKNLTVNNHDIDGLLKHFTNESIKWMNSEEFQQVLMEKIIFYGHVYRLFKYANQQTKEQIQPLLREIVTKEIKKNHDIDNLLEYFTKGTIDWMSSEEFQHLLKGSIVTHIKQDYYHRIDYLLKYTNQQTKEQIQPLLRERVIKDIKNNNNIDYLLKYFTKGNIDWMSSEEFQQILRAKIIDNLKNLLNVSHLLENIDGLLKHFTNESIKWMNSEEFQQLLRDGIIESTRRGYGIFVDHLLKYSNEQTKEWMNSEEFQSVLRGVIIKGNQSVHGWLKYFSNETKEWFDKYLFIKGFSNKWKDLQSLASINRHLEYVSKYILEDEDFMNDFNKIKENKTSEIQTEEYQRLLLNKINQDLDKLFTKNKDLYKGESIKDDSKKLMKKINRILNFLADMDINNGSNVISKIMMQSNIPDRIWIFFAKKLSKNDYFSKNIINNKININLNIKLLRQLLARYPNQFNTIIDTFTVLNIKDFNKETLILDAIRDLGGITPEIYKTYRELLNQSERDAFVEKVKIAKAKLFTNQSIQSFDIPENVLGEMIYLAYNPTNTSLNQTLNYLKNIPENLDQQISNYVFPEYGYDVNMTNLNVTLQENESIKTDFSSLVLNLEYNIRDKKEEEQEEQANNLKKTLIWISKAGTNPNKEQLQAMFSLFKKEDISRILEIIKSAKTDNEKYNALNSIIEMCGILAKDTIVLKVQDILSKDKDFQSKIFNNLSNDKYYNQLSNILGEDYKNDLNKAFVRLLVRGLSVISETAKRDKKRFKTNNTEDTKDNIENNYKYYISKNQASFFAKASGGICTSEDVGLFKMKDYFHINLVKNNERCIGNIQAYIHPDNKGKKYLVLRGFNPSDSVLKSISAKSFVEEAIRIGKIFIKENGLEGLCIVEEIVFSALSNREVIKQYFRNTYNKINNMIDTPHLKYNSKGAGTDSVRLIWENKSEKIITGYTKKHNRSQIPGLPTYLEHYQNQKGRLIEGVPTKILAFKRVPSESLTIKTEGHKNNNIIDFNNKEAQFVEDYMYVLAEDGDVYLPGDAPHWRAVNNTGKLFGYETKDGEMQYYFDVNTKGCGFIRRELVDCNDADTLKGVNENGVEIHYGLSWDADYELYDGNLVKLTKDLTEQGIRTELYWGIAESDKVPFNGEVLDVKEAKDKGIIYKDNDMNPNIGVRLLRTNYRLEELNKSDEDKRLVIRDTMLTNYAKEMKLKSGDDTAEELNMNDIENQKRYVMDTLSQYTKNIALLINNAMTYMYMHPSNLTMLGEIVDMGVVISLNKVDKKYTDYDARFGMFNGIRQGYIKDMTDLVYAIKIFLDTMSENNIATPENEYVIENIKNVFIDNLDGSKFNKKDKESDIDKVKSYFTKMLDYHFHNNRRLGSMKFGIQDNTIPFDF